MPKSNQSGKALDNLLRYKAEPPARGTGGNGSKTGQESSVHAAGAGPEADLQSALKCYEWAVRAHPEKAANWFDFGRLLLNGGQSKRAAAILRQAVRRAPGAANYRYFLGKALADSGKFAEAANHLEQLAAIDPELRDPMSLIGLSVLSDLCYSQGEMGNWKEAFVRLMPALHIATGIIRDLSFFRSKAKEYDLAGFFLSVGLLLEPGNAALLHGTGYCHMQAGRFEEALKALRKAKRANPENPDVWYDLGLTLARMKRLKHARPCFRKVLQLNAEYFWAWYDLACLDALENKPAAAFRNLYKSIECGFKDAGYLQHDGDFKGIRKDPRWRVVLDSISEKSAAAETGGAAPQ